MPRLSETQQLLDIIMAFLDEMVEKYTIFREFNIKATSTSEFGGWIIESGSDLPNLLMRLEGYFMSREYIKKNVQVFLETQYINYSNIRGDELFMIIMRFLDDFFEDHLVLENKKEKLEHNWQWKGYRPTRDRNRISLYYKLTGIVPSRQEMESKVRAFIQMKNL